MARTLVAPLMALALLVLVIVHVEPAGAQSVPADQEREIWTQIAPPGVGDNSGAQTSTGVTLTAGEAYFLYVGANAAWAKIVAIGSSVGQGDLLVINETGGISVGAKASDVRLVSMTNTTATYNPYYAVIRVTPLVTSPYYLATNSGGFGSPGSLLKTPSQKCPESPFESAHPPFPAHRRLRDDRLRGVVHDTATTRTGAHGQRDRA